MRASALGGAEKDQPYASLHVGLLANPKIGFTFGLDLTLPRVRLIPGLTTRLDADVLARSTCQVSSVSPERRWK